MKKIIFLFLISTGVFAQEPFTLSFNRAEAVSEDGIQEFKMDTQFIFNHEGKNIIVWITNVSMTYYEYRDMREVEDQNGIRFQQAFLFSKETGEELEMRAFDYEEDMILGIRRTDANVWMFYYRESEE